LKQCPTCGSSYTDDTLIFCLQDGATLQSRQDATNPLSLLATLRGDSQGGEPEPHSQDPQSIKAYAAPTVELPASRMQTALYDDPRATAPVTGGAADSGSSAQPPANTTRIIAVTVGVTVLVLALGGIGAWLLFRGNGDGPGRARRAAQSNTGAANTSGNDAYNASDGSNSAQSNQARDGNERGDKGGRWFVILGSFPKDEIDRATERMDNLRRQGMDVRVVSSDDYPNFKSGLWLVIMGPFTRNQAEDVLRQARPKVKDAYTKAGW
jgi:cell division septation protein DedD